MHRTWKRVAVVSVLGALLAGGVAGLAVSLVQSRAQTTGQLRQAARSRASLAAALLDSALEATRSRGAGTATASPAVAALLARSLADVARYNVRAPRTRVLLLDARDRVIAASGGGGRGRRLADAPLRAALARDGAQGTFAGGRRFFASAPLTSVPWRVVYTLPTSVLYGARTAAWSVSFALLTGFAVVAAICLLLLVRLLAGSDRLARANTALAERNRTIEGASEAKTRFVTTMSHELRTPLNAVIGFSELMEAGRTGPLSRRQREFLGIIRASARHLLTLINEVLDLSKIESGHMRLDPEAIDPVVVASECVSSLRWLAADRRVRLQFEAAAAGPVSLDPARLRQVILNLLSNAIKFTPAGGRVTLTVARDGDRLLVAVADTGVGIAAEDQRRIFDEFVQVGDAADAGSGLGLAVTRQIVQAQGGEIGVDSAPGRGSTFYAWLPWVPATDGAGSEEPAADGDRSPADHRPDGDRPPADHPPDGDRPPADHPSAGNPAGPDATGARRGRRFSPEAAERAPAPRGAASR